MLRLVCGNERIIKDRLVAAFNSRQNGFDWDVYHRPSGYSQSCRHKPSKHRIAKRFVLEPVVPFSLNETHERILYKSSNGYSGEVDTLQYDSYWKQLISDLSDTPHMATDWRWELETDYLKKLGADVTTIRLVDQDDNPESTIAESPQNLMGMNHVPTDFLLVPKNREFSDVLKGLPHYQDYVKTYIIDHRNIRKGLSEMDHTKAKYYLVSCEWRRLKWDGVI